MIMTVSWSRVILHRINSLSYEKPKLKSLSILPQQTLLLQNDSAWLMTSNMNQKNLWALTKNPMASFQSRTIQLCLSPSTLPVPQVRPSETSLLVSKSRLAIVRRKSSSSSTSPFRSHRHSGLQLSVCATQSPRWTSTLRCLTSQVNLPRCISWATIQQSEKQQALRAPSCRLRIIQRVHFSKLESIWVTIVTCLSKLQVSPNAMQKLSYCQLQLWLSRSSLASRTRKASHMVGLGGIL